MLQVKDPTILERASTLLLWKGKIPFEQEGREDRKRSIDILTIETKQEQTKVSDML